MSNYIPVQDKMIPPKKGKKWLSFLVIGGSLLFLFVVLFLISSFFRVSQTPDSEYSSGSENVKVIHIDGTIGSNEANYNQKWIEDEIARAKFDKDNKAIVLKVNSPGGSAYSSDETYMALLDYKKMTKRPIYAYAEELMASGGYYIAQASDEIYANRNSLVGSIGVIGFQSVDAKELLNKLGVKITTVHSGRDKIMGSLSTGATKEQLDLMQEMTDEVYSQFVGIVAKGRNLSFDKAKALATGRVYTAKQALNNGLIDGISRYDEFLTYLKEKKNLANYNFLDERYENDNSSMWRYLKSNIGKSELSASLEALETLEVKSPMLLYKP